jgi:hypothetical protein
MRVNLDEVKYPFEGMDRFYHVFVYEANSHPGRIYVYGMGMNYSEAKRNVLFSVEMENTLRRTSPQRIMKSRIVPERWSLTGQRSLNGRSG